MIDDELRAIVADVAEIDPASIDPALPFSEAGIDSLMAMEIAVDIERRYDLHFEDAELGQITSFEELVRLTRTRLASRASPSNAR